MARVVRVISTLAAVLPLSHWIDGAILTPIREVRSIPLHRHLLQLPPHHVHPILPLQLVDQLLQLHPDRLSWTGHLASLTSAFRNSLHPRKRRRGRRDW